MSKIHSIQGAVSLFHCSLAVNHLLPLREAVIWNSSSGSRLSAMRTVGRPHVCVWSRRKLAAPEWQGKGSHPQRDCDLHTNSLLIDLHLIWPLKLVEGSQRTGRGEAGPSEVSPAARCKPAAVKGRAWLDGHSHPEGDRRAGDNATFSLAKQQGHFVWPVASNICYVATWKAQRRLCDPASGDNRLLRLQTPPLKVKHFNGWAGDELYPLKCRWKSYSKVENCVGLVWG